VRVAARRAGLWLSGAVAIAALCAPGAGLGADGGGRQGDDPRVDVLRPSGGLPAHIAGQFREPVDFAQTSGGDYLVLDRRAHTVFIVDPQMTSVRQAIELGYDDGQLLSPGTMSLAANDYFAVADAPFRRERIQYFSVRGAAIGAFWLPSMSVPRVTAGSIVLSGVGSMTFTGESFLVNQPDSGALITEIDLRGRVVRYIGSLRPTGQEHDQDVHLAFNVGMPLVDPTGGFYFVFQAGPPMFRKYAATGDLVFERHIEGLELDADIRTMPTTWPERTTESGTHPIVPPLVRTATVDPTGRLWVSLAVPYTYVYDRNGDRVRVVQFRAADLISPISLYFASPGRLLVAPGLYEFSVD